MLHGLESARTMLLQIHVQAKLLLSNESVKGSSLYYYLRILG